MSAVKPNTKCALIQRSCGYSWRQSLSVNDIGKAIKMIKITDLKGRRVGQSLSSNTDGFLSLRDSTSENERVEFILLKEKVEELQTKLLEKDKLESAENSRNQMKALNEKLDELKIQASEMDSLLKSTRRQLLDVKDDLDEMEMQKMVEATKTYKDAVAAAKERRNEESVATAANARCWEENLCVLK